MYRGRKTDARRLMAKIGWEHGRAGRPGRVPFAGINVNPVPADEEMAYWVGYDAGIESTPGDVNPWAALDSECPLSSPIDSQARQRRQYT